MADTAEDKVLNIYTESNPNPNSLKFVVNKILVPDGKSFDYPDRESAAEAPLAQALFDQFNYITRVFFSSNFVTVTKTEEQDWFEIIPEVKEYILNYLQEGKQVITENAVQTKEEEATEQAKEESQDDADIRQILEEYIQPAVEQDGGNISFHSYEDGVVKVILQGSCSGCPSSTMTLKAGIENLLKRMKPEVKGVEAIEE